MTIRGGTFTPGSEEWQEYRSDKIGGSEIGCILGVGFKSAYWLHWHKLGTIPADPDSSLLEWGRRDEPTIINKFADEHPELTVIPNGTNYLRKGRPWQCATPDALLNVTDGILEVKTAQRDDKWGPSGSPMRGNVPTTYLAQVLWTCDVMKVRWAWLAVRVGLSDYREYHLDLDADPDADNDITVMLKAARRFRRDLQNGVHPEPGDGSESTYEAVRYRHPDIEAGTQGEIPADLAGDYTLAVLEEEEAIKRRRGLASRVLEAAGSAHHLHAVNADGEVDHDRFAYRTSRRKADGSDGTPYVTLDSKIKKAMKTIKEAADE